MKNVLLFLSLLLLLSNCKKETTTPNLPKKPNVSFNYTGGGCTSPCAVLFENTSTNANSYTWEFGDGSISFDKNPNKTYTVGGVYNVKLTASNSVGDTSLIKQVLIQKSVQSQLPKASFTFDAGLYTAPCYAYFTNNSQDATEYSWDFGDGGTSNQKNPDYLYSKSGTFTITLTAKNAAGTNTSSKVITIKPAISKMLVKSIKVNNMPLSNFDILNGPDVYCNIVNKNNVVFVNGRNSAISDVTNGMLPLSWGFNTPFPWTDFSGIYIELWDWDSPDADDYIGYAGFSPLDYVSTLPNQINITQNNISLTINVEWQ